MRRDLAILTALAIGLGGAPHATADEPTRPTAPASEANPAVPAAGHSLHGEAFDDGPRQKARLLDGMGQVDFPVTTARSEAQAFITQGVAQLHTFYYFEAERSFRQAALIDPDCAMAYWGLAMANANNRKRAEGFIKEARKRANAKLSRRETLYLEAIEAFLKEGANDKDRRQGWLTGLEAIVQEFPNDLEAKAWMAMVAWQNSQQDGIGSRQAVDTVIEEVLRAEPMHPGAHHYRIHLWDGVKPIRAEKSAALYAKAAPGIAHAWHMPGHTYTGLKRYADAAYQQEGSARVDHAAMIRDHILPFEIFNYAHNNQWLCTSLSHVGRVRDAVAVARDLVEQPRDPDKNGKKDGGSAQRSGRLRWEEVLVQYELWDDLIDAITSGALDWSNVPAERRERAYALGLAYAAKGDKAKLDEQIAALHALEAEEAKAQKTRPDAPDAPKYPWDPKQVNLAAALAELEGHRRLLDGDVGGAFARFAQAGPMRPEALARAHLKARNYGFAESVAKQAVDDHPNEVPPLAAYVEVLQAVGKPKEAREAYRKLEPLARGADADLPVLRRLAGLVAAWKADGAPVAPAPEPATDDATLNRIDLTTLGPLTWSPWRAEPLSRPDTDGRPWSLADHAGRNVLMIFYLGGKCAHCMQQLQAFGKEVEALKGLNTVVVAIGTDDAEATRALKANADGIGFPMPLLADPDLDLFRLYRCYDEFEGRPLHGTFLIDARGDVRFRRVSADPFLDVAFIKEEAARINRMLRKYMGGPLTPALSPADGGEGDWTRRGPVLVPSPPSAGRG